MSRSENSAAFAALTFFAKKHPGELCGSNGLPLTPNSISIFGESQILKTIVHPHLCEYLDIIRGKHERIVAVSEHFRNSLATTKVNAENILKTAYCIVDGLNHLSRNGIVHRNLTPDNILFNSQGDVKLFNYGLYHMTNRGAWVSFPIGNPKYMAPEIFLCPANSPSSTKVDVWSLGMILAELCLGITFWSELKLGNIIRKVLSLANSTGTVFERVANEHNRSDVYRNLDVNLKNFINICLSVDVRLRPTPEECLRNRYFVGVCKEVAWTEDDIGYHIAFLQRVSRDNISLIKKLHEARYAEAMLCAKFEEWPIRELAKRSLKERYFLWQLAGGDVYSQLKKQGMIKSKPPILTLPCLVLLEGTAFGEKRDHTQLLDLRIVELPLSSLQKRIAHLPFSAFHPLLETKSSKIPPDDIPDAASLPLVIREKDIEYQFHRVILFQRLLVGYPSNRPQILKEANKDVTPFFRGDIWAALLDIKGDIKNIYESIDKETTSQTDRQIDVDIPRCHQYNELLASGAGHKKLKRVLKAWVISHPQYVYWQGLDSLCAPFLYLNFNNEAQAYACLSAFIPKYLHDFFLKDNSAVIREYLAKFRHLVAFHDPELACHLDAIHFIPELFAIPWFLTVFSHVFPLHKILFLWDQLLLGDASYPFHVGLAVLNQLRDTLLSSGFNECILLFSDLPEVDIERCVKDSAYFYSLTPRSITFRAHDRQLEAQDPLLDMTAVPLSELQDEFCSRISASDLLLLLQTPEKVRVVDIRNVEQYCAQSIPGSINLPFNQISLSERQVPQSREGQQLEAARGKILAVVGSGGENLIEFCRWLVQCGFPYVCSLHGGIQVLKNANVLQ